METQLGFYVSKRKREHHENDQDSEAAQLIQAQSERHQYEMTAKVELMRADTCCADSAGIAETDHGREAGCYSKERIPYCT